jgi:hypothetical protein
MTAIPFVYRHCPSAPKCERSRRSKLISVLWQDFGAQEQWIGPK